MKRIPTGRALKLTQGSRDSPDAPARCWRYEFLARLGKDSNGRLCFVNRDDVEIVGEFAIVVWQMRAKRKAAAERGTSTDDRFGGLGLGEH
jgi:hypothetical protein